MPRNLSRLTLPQVLLVALLVAILILLPAAATAGAQIGTPADASVTVALERRRLIRADEHAAQREDRRLGTGRVISPAYLGGLNPEPGDLLSVTEKRFRALEMTVEDPIGIVAKKVKSKFVVRGVDFDSTSGLLAIAAVSRVLLFEVSKNRNNLTDLTAPGELAESFGFANDVVFDGRGGLIIADQGAVTGGNTVADGRVWRYELEAGEFSQLAPRRELFNPKLLALDSSGNVYFVDGEGGPLITTVFPDRWDAIWRIRGKNLSTVKQVWNRQGVQATAFDIDKAGRYWLANLAELALIVNNVLRLPCPLPLPFEFVTGLVAAKNGTAFVLDGATVKTMSRWLYGVDIVCTTNEILSGKKLAGARGLAGVEAAGR